MGFGGIVVFGQIANQSTSLVNGNGLTYAAMLVTVVGAVVILSKMLLSRADQRAQEWKSISETERENARRLQAIADKALDNSEAQLVREKAQVEKDQVLLKIVDALRQSPEKLNP